ncbi:MAG: T9SS type A sorting domain-containing protein [Candidatus Electryonea clarkiae]|nr:T9SS type A sorting domain-containing protein [Candidatus Electryonea clarkiae]MDP8288203.1 T9SS type A sorting domain-containing protein [Candidatus Electryonea clarkiae]
MIYRKYIICLVLILLLVVQLSAQVRSSLDKGVIWEGDWFIYNRVKSTRINYPYIYVRDFYGIRVHKIIENNNNLSIDFINRIPGDPTYGYYVSSFINLDGLIYWGDDRVHIAEQSGDSLISRYEGTEGALGGMFGSARCISDDSLVVSSQGIIDLSDPSSPAWNSHNYSSNQAVIVGDRLFSVKSGRPASNLLRIFDISDLTAPVLIDSIDGYFGASYTVQAQKIGYTLAFPWGGEGQQGIQFGIQFVYLDEDLDIADTTFWSYNQHFDYTRTVHSYFGLMNINHTEYFAYFAHEIRYEMQVPQPVMNIILFDPGRNPDDLRVETVILPTDWIEDLPFDFVGEPPCATDENFFLFYTHSFQGGIGNVVDPPVVLFSIDDNFTAHIEVEEDDIYPSSFERTGRGHITFDNGKDLLSYANPHQLLLVNLFTGGKPDTIGIYDDYWYRAPRNKYADMLNSKIILNNLNGNGIDYFEVDERDNLIDFKYTLDIPGGVSRLKTFEDTLYCIVEVDSGLKLYKLLDEEEHFVDSLTLDEEIKDLIWSGELILVAYSDKIINVTVEEDQELIPVDTVNFPERLPSGSVFISDSNWVAIGPYLFEQNTDSIRYVHTFEAEYDDQPPEVVWIDNDRIAINSGYYSDNVLTILSLNEDTYLDSLAFIMDSGNGKPNTYIAGDTVWVWNYSSLMRFRLTGDYDEIKSAEVIPQPTQYQLYSAYPNPFNPDVNITFDIPGITNVNLTVYDLLGRKVTTLLNRRTQPGHHTVIWNSVSDSGIPVSSGLYFVRLESDSFSQTRKIVLLK